MEIRVTVALAQETASLLERMVLALGRAALAMAEPAVTDDRQPEGEPAPRTSQAPCPTPAGAIPPPSAPSLKPKRMKWGTAARDAVLREHIPAGTAKRDIMRLLEAASPDVPMPREWQHVLARSNRLGLRRPETEGTTRLLRARAAKRQQVAVAVSNQARGAALAQARVEAAPRPTPALAASAPPDPPRSPPTLPDPDPATGRIYAPFAAIRAWAGFYGLPYDGSNMDQVNKLRAAKGLRPLVQDDSRAMPASEQAA